MKYILGFIIIIGTLVIAGRQPVNKLGSVFLVILVGFMLLSVVAELPDPEKSSNSSYSSYSYHSNTSNNNHSSSSSNTYVRRRALTKEEANALRGTGYKGTRPNSAAEAMELKAAQITCKECGYHSDNGANSLCDYCQSKSGS